LRLEADGMIPRLALHRARMARGAAALGWRFDPAGFDAALAACDPARGARLRLTYAPGAGFVPEQARLAPSPAVWRLVLAAERLMSGDPWLGIKSTRRAAYDGARAALPEGVDEVIFLNERDEVCDGTITTLFFDRGAGMRTPPLSAGLLPGVLREEMSCPEERLLATDLPRLRLWVGNSLRGLMEAVWVGSGNM
jgi:4-amino-4-deoxychorismate lyase